jgi:hypothetical protein
LHTIQRSHDRGKQLDYIIVGLIYVGASRRWQRSEIFGHGHVTQRAVPHNQRMTVPVDIHHQTEDPLNDTKVFAGAAGNIAQGIFNVGIHFDRSVAE